MTPAEAMTHPRSPTFTSSICPHSVAVLSVKRRYGYFVLSLLSWLLQKEDDHVV
jgi:hypothetical protein